MRGRGICIGEEDQGGSELAEADADGIRWWRVLERSGRLSGSSWHAHREEQQVGMRGQGEYCKEAYSPAACRIEYSVPPEFLSRDEPCVCAWWCSRAQQHEEQQVVRLSKRAR